MAETTAENPTTPLLRVTPFYAAYPYVAPSLEALRWYLRFRADNGLLESGAVVEVRPSPNSKQPMLFIDAEKWHRWMRGEAA
jgi:hypothetical protein